MNQLEIDKYKKRIWHPEIVADSDFINKNNERIKNILEDFNSFYNISFDNYENLYKFLDYSISNDLIKNNNIIFISKDIFDIYIVTEYKYVTDCYKYIETLIEGHAKNCNGKFIVCEELNTEFDYYSASYLIAELKRLGCRGILHATDPTVINNFTESAKKKTANICKAEQF